MRIHIWVLTLLAFGFIPPDAQQIQGSEAKHAFAFGGIEYLPRWSMKNQHEFTPAGQEDLEKWSDMITINIYPDARDGDALSAKANAVLQNYKNYSGRCSRPIHFLGHLIVRQSISSQ